MTDADVTTVPVAAEDVDDPTAGELVLPAPPDPGGDARRELAERLVAEAQARGQQLVGPEGLLAEVTKLVLETGLEVEMTEHLGYDKHDSSGRNGANSRNGTRSKTVLTDIGPVRIDVPRDRDGTFEPATVRKRQRRLEGVDSMVLSLFAKGLTTGEISAHLAEVYDARVSKDTVSKITDAVIEEMNDWLTRALDRVYPVIFIDAIHVKVRDGQVANRAFYVAVGVTVDGKRDILGIWPSGGAEGSKYWLGVLTEIKNRGVGDVMIVCCDGLKGLPDAIGATWPEAIVQTSLVHDALARERPGCHPHRRERASADRPSRSRRRPVPPAGGGPRTASRSCALSAITSDGGGRPKRVSRPRRRTSCRATPASTGAAPTIKLRSSTTTAVSH